LTRKITDLPSSAVYIISNIGFKMKTKILLILIGSIMFLQCCAPTQVTKMTSVASSDQKIAYDGTIISQKKHYISLSPYDELEVAKDKTIFMLFIENCGEDPIKISYNNISIIYEENGVDMPLNRIKVQALDDFLDDLKMEYKYNELKYLKSALQMLKVDSEYGSPASSDSANMGDKMEDIKRRLESMRLKSQLLQEGLVEYDWKQQTIMPGESHTGIVACDTRDMNSAIEGNFQVTVSVDGEEHRFIFNRSSYN
jgi:hypothetical protein